MNLKEGVQKELNDAIKQKDELKTSVLRLLSAAIVNKEKEKRYKSGEEKEISLTDEEVTDVIAAEAKKRKEAVADYEKGGRKELAEKEKKELEILAQYLPEQMSEEEVKKLAQAAIDKIGAKEPKDMGKVMAELMGQVKGKADGNLVSKVVKELLLPQK